MKFMLFAAAATVAGLAAAQAQTSPSKADRNFAVTAARAGTAEVAEAQLALQKTSRQDVKEFAERMVRDHTKAGDQLKQLAQGEGLSLPTQASATDTKEESKLSAESGAAFDKDYIRAQRTAHRQAVALFTQESKNGKDANLKSFAAQTLPTLQDHYRMITAMPTSEHGSTMSSAH